MGPLALLLAMLKLGAKAAAKGVGAVGKASLKGAGKLGTLGMGKGTEIEDLLTSQVDPSLGVLYKAFQGKGKDTTPATSITAPITEPMTLPPIPQNIPQGIIPQGNMGIGGQTPRPTIPSQYMNLANAPQFSGNLNQGMPGTLPSKAPTSRGSFLGGLKEGFLRMPQTGESVPYHAGKLIPDIFWSKMGVSTAGEEARSKKLLEAYGLKEYTPEFKTDLQYSLKRLPTLNENQKVILYQQLAAEYPDRTNELKRIFFPQSQDNEFLRQLITSANF